jgi:septal ring factor EnvC (AmiA/AmiB activator)
VVAYADAFTGFGNLVIVDHGSQTFSLYGNLAGTEVRKGARIQAGQAVGSVGLSPAGPAGLCFGSASTVRRSIPYNGSEALGH